MRIPLVWLPMSWSEVGYGEVGRFLLVDGWMGLSIRIYCFVALPGQLSCGMV